MERILASMPLPSTLAQVITNNPEIRSAFAVQNLERLVEAFSGLSTDPKYQANQVRLDWALRFALAFSRGNKSFRPRSVEMLLNKVLKSARISLLEDPIESPFIERIPTARGDRLVITGLWENAAFDTECSIRAFEMLPDHPIKEAALNRAYALLDLAHHIALRTSCPLNTPGGSEPSSNIKLPSEARLDELSKRIRFSFEELSQFGINADHLLPFVMSEEDTANLIDRVPGNSPLEFMPLLSVTDGVLVASTQGLTTALRADLASTAIQHGISELFRAALLLSQAKLLKTTNFIGRIESPLLRESGLVWRESLREEAPGYWVHLIQLVDDLSGWPDLAFGSYGKLSDAQLSMLNASLKHAREVCSAQEGFKEGLSIMLLGGIGRGFALDSRLGLEAENWHALPLPIADAAVIGLIEEGELSDVWRLVKLISKTKLSGFEIYSANGFLNTFQWWKNNELKLVPESQIDISPPAIIQFGTDLVLQSRLDAYERADFRTLHHPRLGTRHVARQSRSQDDQDRDQIYVDLDAVDSFIPRAAVMVQNTVWWIELDVADYDRVPEDLFRTWEGLVHWAAKCLVYLSRFYKFDARIVCIDLKIEPTPGEDLEPPLKSDHIYETITLQPIDDQAFTISLSPEWHSFLFRADNLAERHAAAAFIEGFLTLLRHDITGVDFAALALEAVGSEHYRWRHVLETTTIVERIKALGLAHPFQEIRRSAGALIQFGTCWEIRERSEGPRIEGREACVSFVREYQDHLLNILIERIRLYDRQALIVHALTELQAAEGELAHWSMTASAMRAIHTEVGDHTLSMERHSQAYGVIRATSIIIEVGLCEAGKLEAQKPSRIDFEELQALALMVFMNGDLLAGLALNRIEPKIQISPTGEILSNHDFERETIETTGKITNLKSREFDAERYLQRFEDHAASDPSEDLQQALKAEFGSQWEVLIDLPTATTHLANERSEGVFVLKRSELISEISALDPLFEFDVAPAIDRLTMKSRAEWNSLPNDWDTNDIDLSRIGRRFSLIALPIVALDETDDPDLVVCPAAIFRSVIYQWRGAMTGSLQGHFWRSKAMRKFAGEAGNIAGNRFDQRIAEALNAAGFMAYAAVKPSWCLNIKASDAVKQLGDIDCLAVDQGTNTVWVIEAKDLQLCKTMGEAARRLSDYQGLTDKRNRPDKLLRHLTRVKFVRDHAGQLCERLGLETQPIVKGLLVMRSPQPLTGLWQQVGEDARVVMLDDLIDYLSQ